MTVKTYIRSILLGALIALSLGGIILESFGYDAAQPKVGITYQYPNMGWWLIHLAAVSLVYDLGNCLWK